MLGTYVTFPELLLWIPLITGVTAIFIKSAGAVKRFALISSLLTLAVSVSSLFFTDVVNHPQYFAYNQVSYYWLPYIGSSFSLVLDGIGFVLTFLTAISFPLAFLAVSRTTYEKPHAFYSLMLLFQAVLMGVFVAYDALVFYFFWELALLAVYFLGSRWGGKRRIAVNFKFFIYSFSGSLLMLIGILYVYQFTPQINPDSVHSFAITAFYKANLSAAQQSWVFWLFFLAFAIRIPIFPLHSWLPDMFEEAPDSTVIVLSGVMVKMGIFAMLRWILPVFSVAVFEFDTLIVTLSVIGIVYAGFIALVQDDLKRFVAWVSIAQIGFMAAAIFSANDQSLKGVVLEMFNNGIYIMGLWVVVVIIEQSTGVRKISELGGLAKKAPAFTIFFLVIALANIGLPFTNGFHSKFLMLSGIFEFNKWLAAIACFGVLLTVVYMLNMTRKVFYGPMKSATKNVKPVTAGQYLSLTVITLGIIILGIYPELLLRISGRMVEAILRMMK